MARPHLRRRSGHGLLVDPGVAVHETAGHEAHQLLPHDVHNSAVVRRHEVVVAARDLRVPVRTDRVLAPLGDVACRSCPHGDEGLQRPVEQSFTGWLQGCAVVFREHNCGDMDWSSAGSV